MIEGAKPKDRRTVEPKDRKATGQGPKKDKREWKADEPIAVEGSRKEEAELASNAEAFEKAPYLHSSGIRLYINEQGAPLGGSRDVHPPPPLTVPPYQLRVSYIRTGTMMEL